MRTQLLRQLANLLINRQLILISEGGVFHAAVQRIHPAENMECRRGVLQGIGCGIGGLHLLGGSLGGDGGGAGVNAEAEQKEGKRFHDALLALMHLL